MDDRRLLWLLALIPVICACSARDLWAPDEPRYGQVAREMMESGNWLVPHVNREPYAEKPPLYWWGVTALSMPLGRVTPISARLGGAIYAFGCAFLLVLLSRRWFGDRAIGVTAAAMFGSMIFVLWVSQRAALDLPLTFYILLAVERGEAWLTTGRLLPAAACGAAWAGAILIKGPLGFLFPPIALAAGAIAAKRVPSWRNAGWLIAPAVMVAIGLAWLLPALEAGGEAYSDRLLGQIKGRATGGEGHHLRPFYYFFERTPVVTMPWSLHLLAGLLVMVNLRKQPSEHRRGIATCAAIGIGGFVFLSAIATKREVYLVPLLPFTCAVTAYAIHRGLFPRIERWGRVFMIGTPLALGFVLLALPWIDPDIVRMRTLSLRDSPAWDWYVPLGAATVALWGFAWAAWKVRAEPPRAIRRTALGMGLFFAVLALGFLPKLDRFKSYAPAAEVAERHAEGGPIYNAGFGQGPNLLWSLDRKRTPLLHGPKDLRAALVTEPTKPAAVVAGAKWWDALRAKDESAVSGIQEVWRDTVDGRGLVVLTSRGP